MKKPFAVLAGALALAALAGPSVAQVDRDGLQRWIDVINRSPVEIREFYMTDVDTRGWGDDRLGQDTVPSGRQMRVVPTPRQRARGYCMFDMRVVFSNNASVERRGVNLCQVSRIVCSSTQSCSIQ